MAKYNCSVILCGPAIGKTFLAKTDNRFVDIDGEKVRTLCQDVQFHRVSDRPIHADFLRISKNAHLTMEIPLHFANEETAPGIKNGGVLNIVHRSLEVSCSPDNIPEKLVLNIGDMNIGDTKTNKDVQLPEGVKLVRNEEITVVTIAEPAKEEPAAAPEPKVNRDDAFSISDMNSILHSKSSSSGTSLGGEFVASHSVSKEPDSSEKKGSLVAGIFDEDKASAAAGSFVPPSGFVPDANDLMKPAIWNKGEYSRTIRLDD